MNNYSNRTNLKLKIPKKISRQTLSDAALRYLARYSTSRANFFRVMMRRVKSSASYYNTSIEEGKDIVKDLTEYYTKTGVLDDKRFVEAQLHSYKFRGISLRVIRTKLTNKGVSLKIVDEVLKGRIHSNSCFDLQAAFIFSKKRKLGPFRESLQSQINNNGKDLAKLARAGFDYKIAKKIIHLQSVEELEEMVESKFRCK